MWGPHEKDATVYVHIPSNGMVKIEKVIVADMSVLEIHFNDRKWEA